MVYEYKITNGAPFLNACEKSEYQSINILSSTKRKSLCSITSEDLFFCTVAEMTREATLISDILQRLAI